MTTRAQCSSEFCCGQWHDYPDIVSCPKCGKTENVFVWEAWGHPNGELYCAACVGILNTVHDPSIAYWTWHMDNSVPIIDVWRQVEQ